MDLREDYITPGNPATTAGRSKLIKLYPYLEAKAIDKYLSTKEGYTLHRWAQKPKYYNNHYLRKRRKQMGIDLLDVSRLKKDNADTTFLLVLIDNFSRLAFVRPLKRKTSGAVLTALKDIFENELPPPLPLELLSDLGSEFVNHTFRKYLKKKKIILHHPFSNKASHIERFNRSLQKLIYQYMNEADNPDHPNYINVLQDLVKSYNTRPHRIIGMSPVEADLPSNRNRVLSHLNKYWYKSESNAKIPKYKVGDVVRIKKLKTIFARGYDPVFTRGAFKIKKVYRKFSQPMYELREYDINDNLLGLFYEHELTLFKPDNDVFRISKTGERRWNYVDNIREIEVFWEGFNEPTWEPVSQIFPTAEADAK